MAPPCNKEKGERMTSNNNTNNKTKKNQIDEANEIRCKGTAAGVGNGLVELLDKEDWTTLLSKVRQVPHLNYLNESIELAPLPFLPFGHDILGFLLGAACQCSPSQAVPLALITTILEVDAAAAAAATDNQSDSNNLQHPQHIAFYIAEDSVTRRTPFHLCVMHLEDRPDICKVLLQSAAAASGRLTSSENNNSNSNSNSNNSNSSSLSLVSMRDVEGLRAIDILTQKILMKEEHLRYNHLRYFGAAATTAVDKSAEQQAKERIRQSFYDCLECARLVTIQHGMEMLATRDNNNNNRNNNSSSNKSIHIDYDLPMLHACCLARSEIPLSLFERAIRRFGMQQALLRDSCGGNTPLHYAAAAAVAAPSPRLPSSTIPRVENDGERTSTTTTSTNEQEQQDEEDQEEEHEHAILLDNMDILPRILQINPQAASLHNHQNEYPIDWAIQRGDRTWNSGCRILLEAYPPAILVNQCSSSLSFWKRNKEDKEEEEDDVDDEDDSLKQAKEIVYLLTQKVTTLALSSSINNMIYAILRAQPEICSFSP